MKPFVSIVALCYNHEPYIKDALDGFLMQETSFDYEVIVHDDASTDNSQKIILEYERRYPGIIRAICQSENQKSKGNGLVTKIAYSAAKGKYIATCECDDFWIDPQKLQKQVDFLEDNPDYIMCFTNGCVVDSDKRVVQDYQVVNNKKGTYTLNDVPVFAPHHTRTFRNFDWSSVPELVYEAKGMDTFICAWLMKFGNIKYFDYVSSAYRIHSGGIFSSLSKLEEKQHLIDTRLILLKMLPGHKRVQNQLIDHLDGASKYIYKLIELKKFYLLFYRIFKVVDIMYKFRSLKFYMKGLLRFLYRSLMR
ncbi:glycosyltransferase [Rufibacter immobilis]|uniref:Glycosyltransferase n=1 Tax=Rufibacter immobilis TaxID=1348778 RepID=A0A3M9MZ84_9BACT|nr:glycosyltransferase [Rufibacter immobilis]RNI30861.1 glycosyltransferase [Rufibacter immobilis]